MVVVGLYFVSKVHAGVGQDVGFVDLPIQRERITGWPIIHGVKGAIRHQIDLDPETEEKIFGPSPEASDKDKAHAGLLSFSEARLLLYPVRNSGKGMPFVWVTSPLALRRFLRDAGRSDFYDKIPRVSDSNIGASISGGNYYLEGVKVTAKKDERLREIWSVIQDILPHDFRAEIRDNFVVISDELFKYLVQATTEVLPRIRINAATGTVEEGNLWYEEYLPMDTVMYVIIRDRGLGNLKGLTPNEAEKLLAEVMEGKIITFGGKVGVGSGFAVLVPKIVGGVENA